MSQAILTALYDKLVLDQTTGSLYDAVGGRIYHVTGPQNAAQPMLTYQLLDSAHAGTFTGNHISARVRFDIWNAASNGTAALLAIGDKLTALLHQQTFVPTGYSAAHAWCVDTGVTSVEGETLRLSSQWRIWATAE